MRMQLYVRGADGPTNIPSPWTILCTPEQIVPPPLGDLKHALESVSCPLGGRMSGRLSPNVPFLHTQLLPYLCAIHAKNFIHQIALLQWRTRTFFHGVRHQVTGRVWIQTFGDLECVVVSTRCGPRTVARRSTATRSAMVIQIQVRIHPSQSCSVTRSQRKMVSNGRAAKDRPTENAEWIEQVTSVMPRRH